MLNYRRNPLLSKIVCFSQFDWCFNVSLLLGLTRCLYGKLAV